MSNPDDEVKGYDQLCTSYRAIDDFRGKLLVVRIRHLVPFDRIEIPRKLSDPKGTIC